MIRKLDETSVNKICANMSIPNIPDIIRELIDNSIDSHSKHVRLELVDSGLEKIIITDNGSGINHENFKFLCKRGTTTKLESFDEIFTIKSMGFRGQALSAICCLCDLTIITKTISDEKVFVLNYDHEGNLTSQNFLNESLFLSNRKIWENQSGTIIIIENIFKNNLLRKKVVLNKRDSILNEIIDLVQSYAIIRTEINFEFFSEIDGKNELVLNTINRKSLQINLNKIDIMRNRIENIFGKQFVDKLLEVNIQNDYVKIEGFLSKDIQSGSKYNKSKSTKFYFINSRKINKIRKIDDIILNIYRQYNKDVTPVRILNLIIPEGDYDINLSESKNEVILKYEKEILNFIDEKIKEFHEEKIKIFSANCIEQVRGPAKIGNDTNKKISMLINQKINSTTKEETYLNENIQNNKRSFVDRIDRGETEKLYDHDENSFDEKEDSSSLHLIKKSAKLEPLNYNENSVIKNNFHTPNAKLNFLNNFQKNSNIDPSNNNNIYRSTSASVSVNPKLNFLNSFNKNQNNTTSQINKLSEEKNLPEKSNNAYESDSEQEEPKINQIPEQIEKIHTTLEKEKFQFSHQHNSYEKEEIKQLQLQEDKFSNEREENKKENLCVLESRVNEILNSHQSPVKEKEVKETNSCMNLDTEDLGVEELEFNFTSLNNTPPCNLYQPKINIENSLPQQKRKSFTNAENVKQVIKTFEKSNFTSLNIIGQFNKGFIIANNSNNELFIIDQHAADEKKNYEDLLNNIKIVKQPTLFPIKIELLSISEKNTVFEKKNLFERLGFTILKQSNKENTREDLYITTFPSIYSYSFKYDDFLNIYHKLEQGGYKLNDEITSEELRKLFLSDSVLRYVATKACRSSIMIGTGLDKIKMKSIIRNLAELLSPWNCPHGRPTMRFLCKLDTLFKNN
jgi:DNA mismatch repair protein PMS2